jgi:hypothetical protein
MVRSRRTCTSSEKEIGVERFLQEWFPGNVPEGMLSGRRSASCGSGDDLAAVRSRGVMGDGLPEICRPRRVCMVNQDRLTRLELLANRAGGFVGVDMEQREPHPYPE